MVMTFVQAWAVWCGLTLISSGAGVVAPAAHAPHTVNAASTALNPPQPHVPPQEHKPSWRSDRTSGGSNVINKLGASLSDSSSSPVEPIKPLLDLSLGDTSGSLTVPLHPVFDEAAPFNVSAMTGNTAYLHCLVHNLGNKSVSWIRQRDLHIMTVGRYTYTTDQRFEVINSPGSKDWILKIKYAQVRDSGNYECQVSTKPVRTYVVHLNIFEPQAEIIGAPDIHVDMGSAINLTCVISHSPEPPAYIFWYHNGKVMSYDSPRGSIAVMTNNGNSTSGYLLIQDAQTSDTGNYSCKPSNTAAASIGVHVLNGETPAAMQTNGAESFVFSRPTQIMVFALLTVLTAGDSIQALSDVLKGLVELGKGLSLVFTPLSLRLTRSMST